MAFDSNRHHRRTVRLKDFDYSANGCYFITICTQNRTPLFGTVTPTVGADSISAHMQMNNAGKMINSIWVKTINEINHIQSPMHVVMPNHFHAILAIERADMESAPTPTIGTIIQSFKRHTTIEYIRGVKSNIFPPFTKRIWQRNYYEHVIRNDEEYQQIWTYIENNPINWQNDDYYTL